LESFDLPPRPRRRCRAAWKSGVRERGDGRHFSGLDWPTSTECELTVDGGFSVTWTVEEEEVQDGYTNGGFNHLNELAAVCKKQGWRIADAQEGEDIDLDDPKASFSDEEDEEKTEPGARANTRTGPFCCSTSLAACGSA